MKPLHFFLIAGEASGDMHGAHLVQAIKAQSPSSTFSGLGGPLMRQSGVHVYEDLTQKAVVGFAEVLRHYWDFRRIFFMALQKVRETKPDAVILIDYPGFNLRFAKAAKKLGARVFYYISPQVWAWKENRVRTIKTCVDKMLVLFDFEKDFYARHGIKVDFVGHPLADMITVRTKREDFLRHMNFDPQRLTLGMLPGSREKEVQTILPVMIHAASLLCREFPSLQILIFKAPSVSEAPFQSLIKRIPSSLNFRIVESDYYEGLNACNACLVASGTATLETALLKKPMVVIYKTSLLTWALAKALIKIPYVGLVNIVAGKKIVPECLQFQANGKTIARELKAMLTNEMKLAEIHLELERVRERIGGPGASARAAQTILKDLE